ncbi:MAG: ATP-binding protein [Paracoccaceae bacterium]
MLAARVAIAEEPSWFEMGQLEKQLKDYIDVSLKLIWQRQAIFLAATLLSAFYIDAQNSFLCYSGVIMTEILDLLLSYQVRRWTDGGAAKAKMFLNWVVLNTFFSAMAISLFVVMIALEQEPGARFTPMFFLFAAALFAAMNNHQLVPALILRLIIYGATFIFIALLDIYPSPPPITSPLWLQFFTVIFVLYFIVDCSLVFLRLYRAGLRQIDELRMEHEKTKIAYEVKSKFVSTVSHELRTPLTSIKASIDLVNSGVMGEVPQKMTSVMQIAGKNSKRLADLINDLLDLQKIEAGEMVYRFQTISVRRLVLDAIEANKSYGDKHGIAIEAAMPDDALFIEGDESRLMQVMTNLLSNAVKFSEESGTVTVDVTNTADRVRISVRDEGVGIPDGSKELVFGKFTQVDSSDQRRSGGTGLGMNITKQIVERHNGTIDYVSELGRGSTFFVEFVRTQQMAAE